MIFWSSPERIRDRVLSITATTESVVAAGLICFLGLYFDNFLILLPGVFVAWLVLLRSKESVEPGAKWFTRWEHRGGKPGDRQTPATRQSAPSQLLSGKFLLRGAVGFAVAFMLAHLSLKQLQGWELFLGSLLNSWIAAALATGAVAAIASLTRTIVWRGVDLASIAGSQLPESLGAGIGTVAAATVSDFFVLSGAIVAATANPWISPKVRASTGTAAIVGAIGIAVGLVIAATTIWGPMGLLAAIGVGPTVYGSAAGVLFLSILIRIGATFYHLWSGLKSFPVNFYRLVFCTSPTHFPELVPGLTDAETRFTLENLLREYRSQTDLLTRAISLVLIAGWFVPGWLYRVGLKSMFWFWWPIAFIGDEPKKSNDPELYAKQVMNSDVQRVRRILAWVAILAFVGLNSFYLFKVDAHVITEPLPTIVVMFLLVGLKLPVWQLAGLLGSVVFAILPFLVQNELISWEHARERNDVVLRNRSQRRFILIERLCRVRTVFVVVYLLGSAGHLLLLANSQRCWFSPSASKQRLLVQFYGKHLPIPSCNEARVTDLPAGALGSSLR